MVNLNLAQTPGFMDYEEYKKLHVEQYKQVEFTEQFQKCALERKKTLQRRMQKRMQKKKEAGVNKTKKSVEKEEKVVERKSFDEMIESVDALLSTLDSLAETKTSKTPVTQPPPSPTTSTEIAELDAHDTSITKPSPAPPEASNNNRKPPTLFPQTPIPASPSPNPPSPPIPITITTPLHSNPLSTSDLAFARHLSAAHHARATVRTHLQNPLAAFDAITQYGQVATRTTPTTTTKKLLSSSPFLPSTGVFGEILIRTAKASREKRTTEKMPKARGAKKCFSEAVKKGVRGLFG